MDLNFISYIKQLHYLWHIVKELSKQEYPIHPVLVLYQSNGFFGGKVKKVGHSINPQIPPLTSCMSVDIGESIKQ